MTVNLSLRRYQIWVCKPGEDETTGLEVTEACGGNSGGFFVASDEPIDENGRIQTKGTLVLAVLPGFIESLDSDLNPSRWAIGNKVVVQVADSSGTFQLHPRSGLQIAECPNRPYPGNNFIALQLTDTLSLCDYRQPDDDKSGINFGTSSERGDIIKALLKDAKLDFQSGIPEYPLDYPIPKQSGSYVNQAGSLAIGAERLLYVDRTGEIRAIPIDLKKDEPLLSRSIGINEAGFEPMPPGELPCELVKAVGVGYELTPIESGNTVDEEFAPRETIVPGSGTSNTLSARNREQWGWEGNQFKRTVSRYEARGTVLPDSFFTEIGRSAPGSAFSLVFKESTTDLKIYEGGKEGRLLRQVVTTTQPRGVVFADYYKNHPPGKNDLVPWFEPIVASEITTIYESSKDSMTRRVYTAERKPRGSIAGPADDWTTIPNLTSPAFAQSDEKTWTEQNKTEWRSTEKVKRSGLVQSGTIAAFLSSATTKNETTVSRSGQNQPPAAERRAAKHNQTEKQYTGQAKFKPLAGAAFVERTHTHQFNYIVSDEQLNRLAKLFGTLRHGRHRGFRLTTEFADEWFDYQPLARIDVVDGDKTLQGWADSVTWTLADDEAIVVADCGLVGTSTTDRPTLQPPFVETITLSGSSRSSGQIIAYPYPLHPQSIVIAGHSRSSGRIVPKAPTITMSGHSRSSGRIVVPIVLSGRSRSRGKIVPHSTSELSSGLTAAWGFNGDLDSDIGNVPLSGSASFTSGVNGQAVLLSASNELVCPDSDAISIGFESFSIGAVVHLTENTANLSLVRKQASGSPADYRIVAEGLGGSAIGIEFRSRLGFATLSGANRLPPGTYLLVCWQRVSQNLSELEIGIWAREVGTNHVYTVTANPYYEEPPIYTAGTGSLRLGGIVTAFRNNAGGAWIDSLGLWKRSLSAGDRDAIYNGGSVLEYPY